MLDTLASHILLDDRANLKSIDGMIKLAQTLASTLVRPGLSPGAGFSNFASLQNAAKDPGGLKMGF